MPSRKANNHTKTAAHMGNTISSAGATGLADPTHGGGVNSILKGDQSWNTSAKVGPGAVVVGNIAARVLISLLLIAVMLALAVEAIRLDGIAAPILGR